MNATDKDFIISNFVILSKELSLDPMLHQLEGFLGKARIEAIRSHNNPIFAMISSIMRRGPNAFKVFMEAIRECHPVLFETLQRKGYRVS